MILHPNVYLIRILWILNTSKNYYSRKDILWLSKDVNISLPSNFQGLISVIELVTDFLMTFLDELIIIFWTCFAHFMRVSRIYSVFNALTHCKDHQLSWSFRVSSNQSFKVTEPLSAIQFDRRRKTYACSFLNLSWKRSKIQG